MTKAFIIHGSYGNPEENWFPWLKEKLELKGYQVFVPKFPTPEDQSLKKWMEMFDKKYKREINQDTIFIGHSLGPAFILSILETLSKPIKACFFVSGFIELLNNKEFDDINKTFTTKKFDWDKIIRNCKNFHIYHSDNDPYVSKEKSVKLAKKLNTSPIIIKGAGHFNEKSGYKTFDILLENITQTTL